MERRTMFCPLIFILIPLLLDYSSGLSDVIVSSLELSVHVGDSALMECVFQRTEEKRVIKVDWMFSSKEHAKEDYVLYYYSNLSVSVGRFRNRTLLVGDILHHDGSLLLQNVEEADQGTYTCEIRLEMESEVLKRSVVLHVLPEEPRELTVHVGDPTQMGCVFESTAEKRVTNVEWTFSSEGSAKEESVLRYNPNPNAPVGYPQTWGRFQNRVSLVGDPSHNGGSIMLQGVKESDRGNYTCRIYMGNKQFKKTIMLHVILKESQRLVTSGLPKSEILAGGQLVTIVGIICATILLLSVLILIMKRTHISMSSPTSTKNLENTKKAEEEKHVYSPIIPMVPEEEEPSGKSEAMYMTMHPVRPSLRSMPPEGKSAWGVPQTMQAF
ncbi:junctional adhesion molecule-like [Talpa occidentalis]|uniref:junctional adhesion molecule-like n=1 Tax=Talpa occidentalis TaxID=50954 RepID=UPI00188E1D7C|nr:junctional adhesion molecule-like [Talpa occidentalis]